MSDDSSGTLDNPCILTAKIILPSKTCNIVDPLTSSLLCGRALMLVVGHCFLLCLRCGAHAVVRLNDLFVPRRKFF